MDTDNSVVMMGKNTIKNKNQHLFVIILTEIVIVL